MTGMCLWVMRSLCMEGVWRDLFLLRFSVGCKKAGYVGNATRLWAAINDAPCRHQDVPSGRRRPSLVCPCFEDHGDVICLDQLARSLRKKFS